MPAIYLGIWAVAQPTRSNHSTKTSQQTMRDAFRGKHPRRAREVKANEYPRKIAMTKGMKEKKETPCGRPQSYWNKRKKSVCSTSRNCSPKKTRARNTGSSITVKLMYMVLRLHSVLHWIAIFHRVNIASSDRNKLRTDHRSISCSQCCTINRNARCKGASEDVRKQRLFSRLIISPINSAAFALFRHSWLNHSYWTEVTATILQHYVVINQL